jgi:DUF4097 and DUF4098 domain-containing protein YvlB
MTEKRENKKDINHEVNLQFINKVRNDVFIDPKTQGVVIMQRNEDVSVFTITDEENVLLSFSS